MSQIKKQKPPLFVRKRYNQQVNVMFMVRQKRQYSFGNTEKINTKSIKGQFMSMFNQCIDYVQRFSRKANCTIMASDCNSTMLNVHASVVP